MEFDIYCDESRPDLFSSKTPSAAFLVIGSVWLQTADRERFKDNIHEMRNRHKIGGEFKWQKISPSKVAFYLELINWFFDQGDSIRFRCIAVDHIKANLIKYHDNDQELAFYKFYYQLLHHWILDFNAYSVFCDLKVNRSRGRLTVLKECLECSNLSSTVGNVQGIRSTESVLIQLVDVLIGAASARLNDWLLPGKSKEAVVNCIEHRLSRRIAHTYKGEQKFNVFKIDLSGGW